MLKKKIVMLIAAAMMTLSASSAFAAFADLELIRVYYDRSGAEIATDLGNVKDLIAPGQSTTKPGSFSTIIKVDGVDTTFTATKVVYFALDRLNSDLWATNSTTTAPLVIGGTTGLTAINAGTTSMYLTYNSQGGTNYAGLATATNSYKNKLSSTQGWLGNTITGVAARAATELSLSNLATNNTQTLYFWDNAKAATADTDGRTGVAVAQIITNADGSSTIVTANTPIPPAFFLMGSGLLGMFGLRRKVKAA
ncbi:MAG: hypothetical protein WC156_10375 [Pedobacter sp.]